VVVAYPFIVRDKPTTWDEIVSSELAKEALNHWAIKLSLFSLDSDWCRGNIDSGTSTFTPRGLPDVG